MMSYSREIANKEKERLRTALSYAQLHTQRRSTKKSDKARKLEVRNK